MSPFRNARDARDVYRAEREPCAESRSNSSQDERSVATSCSRRSRSATRLESGPLASPERSDFEELVALRVLSAEGSLSRDEHGFQLEAELASRIQHRNVARCFDTSKREGLSCSIMEWIEGRSLGDAAPCIVESGPDPARRGRANHPASLRRSKGRARALRSRRTRARLDPRRAVPA